MVVKCLLVLLGPHGVGHPSILTFPYVLFLLSVFILPFLSSNLCVTLGFSKVAIEQVLLNIDDEILESPNELEGC